jgi:hypothetical protein
MPIAAPPSATPRAGRNARDELSMLPVMFEQARALTTLGDRPLVVLTSAENARDTDGWTEAQEHMAELSGDAVTREPAASHAGIVEDPGEPQRPCRPSPPSSGRSAPGRPSRRAEPAPTRVEPGHSTGSTDAVQRHRGDIRQQRPRR